MFLNEEKKKLSDCTDAEIAEIVKSKTQQVWACGRWSECGDHLMHGSSIYRVCPTSMQVDWSHIDKKWNHIRVDSNGGVYIYANKPYLDMANDAWDVKGQDWIEIYPQVLASFIRGNLPWDQAICDRPGHE